MNGVQSKTANRCLTCQKGGMAMIATVSLMIVGAALVMSQISSTKSDTSAVQAAQTGDTAAGQAAALAAAAGVAFVNGLGSNGLCTGSTGCSSGVYGSAALTGGAGAQASSWWTSGNAHAYSYAGLNATPLYAVEYVSCDNTGLATYKVTGRAVPNSAAGQGGSPVLFYKTVTKSWGVSGSSTGLFLQQAQNGGTGNATGPNVNLGNTVTLNASTPGSTLNFTSGSTGTITLLDLFIWENAGANPCSQYAWAITLSKNNNAVVTNYNVTNNNWVYYNPGCGNVGGKGMPWDGNTTAGFPLSPGFAVTSGDVVTVKITTLGSYSGNIFLQGVSGSTNFATQLGLKLIGTKTGAPNCPS